jgi:hypothetical protein
MNPSSILRQAQEELSGSEWEYLADMTGHPGEQDSWLGLKEYVRRTNELKPVSFNDHHPFRISAYANALELLGEESVWHTKGAGK